MKAILSVFAPFLAFAVFIVLLALVTGAWELLA
jgi:hypothetical protein